MKKVVIALGLIASTIWLGACSKEEDEEEPTGLEYCESSCESAVDCGFSGFDVDDCKQSCKDAKQAARRASCSDEFDSVAKCTAKHYSCEPDTSCKDVLVAYSDCFSLSGS